MKPELTARGLLQLAIKRLLARYPLFGALAASWEVVWDRSIRTMGVGMGETRIQLFYNDEFVLRISLEELTGVMHHEVRHVIYGHVFTDAAHYPDAQARLIAEEVTINEKLSEPLPGKPIVLADHPQLPPDESTHVRYQRLVKNGTPTGAPPPPAGTSGAGTSGATGAAGASGAIAAGAAQKTKRAQKSQGKPGPSGASPDNHSRWPGLRANEMIAQAQVRNAARTALSSGIPLTDHEERMIEELAEGFGMTPGSGWSELTHTSEKRRRVDWRTVLRQFVARATAPSYSFARPSRRLPHLLGIVPGRQRRTSRSRILAVIDTSGSMSDEILAGVSAELTALSTSAEIQVVEVDAKIQRVYPYRTPIKRVQGRGGTNFHEPLDAAFLRKMRPDGVCIFTDGDGLAPKVAPEVPALWVLTPYGESPVKWGRVVHMDLDETLYIGGLGCGGAG